MPQYLPIPLQYLCLRRIYCAFTLFINWYIIGDKESSSSDWSSSDEDDDEGDEAPLRPSTHSALQAQWEWRTMADSLPDK